MYIERSRPSLLSRPGPLIAVIAVHLAIAYLLSISMGVVKMPKIMEAAQVIFIPDQPVQPEPELPVVKPDIAQQQIDTPMPQIQVPPEIEAPPVEAPPSEAAPVAAAASQVGAPSQDLRVKTRTEPVYPPASRRAGEEGTVRLRILVDERGMARDVVLVQGSGFARLDQAAMEAVRKWRFVAASDGNQNITVWTQVAVTFRLTDQK